MEKRGEARTLWRIEALYSKGNGEGEGEGKGRLKMKG